MKYSRKNTEKYKKIQKKRKGKTQKKKIGGKINLSNTSPRQNVRIEIPNNEVQFAKSLLTHSQEYCGKYVVQDPVCLISPPGNTCVLKHHQLTVGTDSNGRKSCVIHEKEFYSVIWHTHPNDSKFYPSTEDILTVKRHRNTGEKIKLSIIYTSIGIWTLESFDDDVSVAMKQEINDINDNFYRTSFKGRTTTSGYDFNIVKQNIILYTDEMFHRCNMNIIFFEYTQTQPQSINYVLDNVRVDSLTA
jgi:hypothetical protein